MTQKKNPYKQNFWKKTKCTVNAVVLCLRFPFLWPRNRFSGLHWTSYKIEKYIKKIQDKAVEYKYRYIDPDSLTQTRSKKILNIPLYVWYLILQFVYKNVLQWFHCIPTFTELDAMPDSWRKAFGIQMCKEIREALIKKLGWKGLFRYRIMQIKEKYGDLRWYDGNSCHEVFEIIDKYSELSSRTCISCGKPATWLSTGWISPYCDDCIGDTPRKTPIKQADNQA